MLTVLDLIGQQRREFRFDLKYRALTGASRTGLERQLEQGFAYLPSGCELVLDAVAQRTVLENIRRQLKLSRKELVVEWRGRRFLVLTTYDTDHDILAALGAEADWVWARRWELSNALLSTPSCQ